MTVSSPAAPTGCPAGGVIAVGRGRRRQAKRPPARRGRGRPRARRSVRRVAVRPAALLRLPPDEPGRRTTNRATRCRHVPHLPDPRDRPPWPHPAPMEGRVPGLIHHRAIIQRRHRSRERDHRAPPPPRARVPQPRELPAPHAPRRRRPHPMTPTRCPKSPLCPVLPVFPVKRLA